MGKGLPEYDGLRFTADGADCAMPIAVDSHSSCSYCCLYCFSNSLMRSPERFSAKRERIEKYHTKQFEWNFKNFMAFLRRDLKGRVPEAMYPLLDKKQPLQIGALGDPFDEEERRTGWMLKVFELITKLEYPIRVSTKGAEVILQDEYLEAFNKASKWVWVNFSIIHPEDDVMSKIDLGAPSPSRRFEAMKKLSEVGVKTGLRYRPAIPHLALKKVNGEPAWKVMIDKTVEAGGVALSFEFIFLNHTANELQRRLYYKLQEAIDTKDFVKYWKHHSVRNQNCLRANRLSKYGLFKNIFDYAKEMGLVVGISDPHFKEFSDTPCCCGIPEDDSIFGNFSRDCMTTLVVNGRKAYEKNGENLRFTFQDWAPEWGKKIRLADMVCLSSADKHKQLAKCTWYDQLRNHWNHPTHFRSPYYYFEGVLRPVEVDDNKDVVYEYRHWEGQIYKDVDKLEKLAKNPSLLPLPTVTTLKEVFA